MRQGLSIFFYLFISMGYAHASKADSLLSKTLKSAEQGDAQSQFLLGAKYSKQDVYWSKKSAEQGNALAKTILNTIKR